MRSFALALLLALGAPPLLTACGGPTEYVLVGSERAPGADGTVQVEEIEGGNRLVTVTVSNMPPPERLGRELTTYVVWFVAEQAVKAGVLEYEESSREGQMFATTPQHGRFTLRITAERSAAAEAPGEVVVAEHQIGGENR